MKIQGQPFTKKLFEQMMLEQMGIQQIVYVDDVVPVSRHMCLANRGPKGLPGQKIPIQFDQEPGMEHPQFLKIEAWVCSDCRKALVYRAALPFG